MAVALLAAIVAVTIEIIVRLSRHRTDTAQSMESLKNSGRQFLDEHFAPFLDKYSHIAADEYKQSLAIWRLDRVQRTAKYDTDRFVRLQEIVDGRLQIILTRYDRRVAFNIARAVLPFELHHLVGVASPLPADFFGRVLAGVSRAIGLFGGYPISVRRNGETAAIMTVAKVAELRQFFPADLARVHALVILRMNADTGLRRAGKGQKLTAVHDDPNAPWEFEPDLELEAAIDDYDRRRRHAATGIGGMITVEDLASTTFLWPVVGACSAPVKIRYRSLGLEHITYAFMLSGRDMSHRTAHLEDFAGEFRSTFGLDLDTFLQICRVLAKVIFRQTAFGTITESKPIDGTLIYTSSLARNDKRYSIAPTSLMSILSQGALRAPRDEWRNTLTKGDISKESVDTFIAAFTVNRNRDPALLTPAIFYVLDENSIVLDMVLMNDFLDLCFHAAVVGRDGRVGKDKGKKFEEQARAVLVDRLSFTGTDLPLRPNYKLRTAGVTDAEVDFCFIVGSVLVQVEMKSWSRPVAYQRGDFHAIQNRLDELRKILDTIDRRGRLLLDHLRPRHPQLTASVNLVCVADAEFVPPDPDFHYAGILRVRTPNEIADLVQNTHEWNRVLLEVLSTS